MLLDEAAGKGDQPAVGIFAILDPRDHAGQRLCGLRGGDDLFVGVVPDRGVGGEAACMVLMSPASIASKKRVAIARISSCSVICLSPLACGRSFGEILFEMPRNRILCAASDAAAGPDCHAQPSQAVAA